MRDTIVKYTHSQQLCDACAGPAFLLLPELMDHSQLDVFGDFIAPLFEFFANFGLDTLNFSEAEK